jgi:hypothetical protein
METDSNTFTFTDLFEAAPAAQAAADETGTTHYVRKERATGLLVVQPATPVDGRRFLTMWGPAEPTTTTDDLAIARARYLGADAALAAASWVEMDEDDARSILDDVDPQVLDRYPEPNLSGEMAGDPTPESLAAEVTGEPFESAVTGEIGFETVNAICDAWEEGRDAVWSDALQAHALRVLGDVARALEVEQATEAYVDTLRSASR